MKYQVVKQLKTKAKTVSLHNSMVEAEKELERIGAGFVEMSYIGAFPVFQDEGGKTYSIQGLVGGLGIVCSLPEEALDKYQSKKVNRYKVKTQKQ